MTAYSTNRWTGLYECGCRAFSGSVTSIPEFCPEHSVKLVSDDRGVTKRLAPVAASVLGSGETE